MCLCIFLLGQLQLYLLLAWFVRLLLKKDQDSIRTTGAITADQTTEGSDINGLPITDVAAADNIGVTPEVGDDSRAIDLDTKVDVVPKNTNPVQVTSSGEEPI